MNVSKLIRLLVVTLGLVTIMPSTVLAQVYSCTGPDGERYFSDTPCQKVNVLEQNLEKEMRRARMARIEELEVSITKIKRELMDTDTAYFASLSGRGPEELAILKENYEEKTTRLRSQLTELQASRADLVDQSFADHASGMN